MMTNTVQKISPFKAASCPRGSTRAVAVRPTPALKKQAEGAINWASLPVAAASAVVLLTSGAASATALGKGYGGSVGGSDQFQETVERGIGKVAPGTDTANSPFNLEDPNKVVDNATSDTLGGALNKTVRNVKNTFSTGGQNVKEVTNDLGSKVEGAASNVQSSSPDIFKQSAQNQAEQGKKVFQTAEEGKNIFQSGADKIQEFVGGGPSSEPFKTGADALQQGGDAAKDALQSGKNALTQGGNPLSQGGMKAKQTAGAAQDAFRTGTDQLQGAKDKGQDMFGGIGDALKGGSDKVQEGAQLGKQTAGAAQDAFRTGTDQLQGAKDKGQNIFGGIGDALKGGIDTTQRDVERGAASSTPVSDFRAGTDQLEKGGKKVQALAEDVQSGAQEAGRKAQQTGRSIFGQ